MPAELGNKDGRNAAAAAVGLVNGKTRRRCAWIYIINTWILYCTV